MQAPTIKLLSQLSWHKLFLISAIAIILFDIGLGLNYLFRENFYGDFFHFYQAARALIEDTHLYKSGNGGYIYPPFFAFMLTPLGFLSERSACLIWQIINIILLIPIFFLGFRILTSAFQLKPTTWQALGICSLTFLLSYHEFWWEYKWVQNDLLILAGFMLSLFWMDRKPDLAGFILGILANIKYQALFFLPYLLFRGRWRMSIGLILGIITASLLPALLIGWDQNLNYLVIALRGILNMPGPDHLTRDYAARVPDMLWRSNMSITSGLARVFVDHGLSKTDALLVVLGIACILLLILWKIFNHQGIGFIWRNSSLLQAQKEKALINLEWGVLLLCMLILSPQCIMRHLILLIYFNLMAVLMLFFPRTDIKK